MADLSMIGSSGLNRQGGYVYEPFVRELQGAQGRAIFRQMAEEDPIIGAFLYAVEMLLRRVTFQVVPASEAPSAHAAATFVSECLTDMSLSWEDTLAEILSFLVYGWSFVELVYKIRGGDARDPRRRSKYADGKIGWRKFAIRAQDTLERWEFDAEGGIQGMWQVAPPAYTPVFIPIDKALLFRTTARRGSPEGRSVLLNAYRPWWFKRRIEEIEAVGIERDLAGLPVAWVPPDVLDPNAPPELAATRQAIEHLITNIRRDQQEGVLFPLHYDDQGRKLYDLTLLSTGGTRQFQTDAIIARYDQRLAMTLLADFILLGHEAVGSKALGMTKASIFSKALQAWAEAIAGVITTHAIPRLLRLNGIPLDDAPRLQPSAVEDVDLDELGNYIARLAGAGAPLFPDAALLGRLLDLAGLPQPAPEEGP